MDKKDLLIISVIVPAYKQEKTIKEDLAHINEVLEKTRYRFEIICVVDGFVDKTFQQAKSLHLPNLQVLGYKNNLGKGHAVRLGMSKAVGDVIAFLDAGMDINPNGLSLLLEHLLWYDSDVIVGSIRHSASRVIGYPLKRHLYSLVYHWIIKILFGLRITDSQRGLKLFKRQVLDKVLPRLLVKRWAFDIEMLAVAKRLGFIKIHDGPVELDARKMRYSSIRTTTIFNMLKDTLAVWYRLNILHYYDDRNREKWSKNLKPY